MAVRTGRRNPTEAPALGDTGDSERSATDLASRWVGSSVLSASDESFGDKENLLTPDAAAFEPGHYGNRGEIVDGWETRRRREPGHDWALVRLGTPGIITSIDVDTSFFTGNFPESCEVDACGVEGYPSSAALLAGDTEWISIVPRSPLRGDTHNLFPVSGRRRFTHVRLSIYPDGGVARLRILGHVVPDPRLLDGITVNLAGSELGAGVVASSDNFYSSAASLLRADRARTMGEGWETRRRRDGGPDFVVVQLAYLGHVRQVEVDTAHFKYNASESISLHGAAADPPPSVASPAWTTLLPRAKLQPDTRHMFPVGPSAPVSAVRLDAYPDGGVSRLRVMGELDPSARRRAGLHWFNALPAAQATGCLTLAGMPPAAAAPIVGGRPLSSAWRTEALDRLGTRHTREASAHLAALAAMLDGVPGR